MTIRFQLLLFVITGYLLVIAVFLFSIIQRDKVQEETSAESLVILYESAWYQNYNNNYEFMSKWIPNIGENGNIWDPYDETFIDEIEQVGNFSNPIVNSIKNRSIGDLQYIMELVFEEELDEGSLSFIMAYFPNSQRFYCGSSLDLFGIDACSPQAKPEFIDSINRFISDSSERPRQNIINIFDVENNKASTLNQIYSFPIKINQETIAIIILGIDIRKTLEIFEDEYEVRTAIKIPTGYVSLENDYSSDNSDLVSRYNINNYSETINAAENLFLENGSRTSLKVDNLGNSLTFIPLSSYLSSDKAQLFIIKDEKLSIETSNDILNRSFVIVTITILLIISLTTFINYRTFGGITRAIGVLNGLTKGDHSQKMPKRSGILSSEKDEVGQLSNALLRYRDHLLEMEEIREEQAKRRKERDNVIIQKMSFLADRLEGDAKILILEDIKKMQALAKKGDGASTEDASVELMSLAFARMSDEVNSLISARTKEMETSRDEARDANAEKTRFFANMSHELRTPLNAILGYGEMLEEDCEDLGYDDLLPDLRKITSAGSHLLSLINNILDISKIEAGRMELYLTNFDIESMIDTIKDVTGPLSIKNENNFVVNITDNIGKMNQDETKIRQCLTNFLSNSFKFTSKGNVELKVDTFILNETEMIRFAVIDDGEGMSEEGLSKVFKEYEQAERSTSAKHGGTGLGLPITKKLAEMMGGDVEVMSELGKGSQFTLYVPRYSPEQEDLDIELIDFDKLTEQEKIIVLIDDDVDMHELIRRTVTKIGLTLVGATDGEKGMQIVREVKPKLLLLDVLMPGRDGWSILKECKTDPDLKDMSIIMVSQMEQDKLSKSLGADDYMTKPINRDLFLERVKNLMTSSTSNNGKVLIVDDDKDTREILSRILDDNGWISITAKDGKDGLEKLKENPSLIVLDLEMPRMDGFEFLDEYMNTYSINERKPILVYSGKDLSEVQIDQLNKNVAALIKKDEVSMQELSNVVKDIYNKEEVSINK
tara:strand:+ start:624 stop:3629 length:3006 start_codon:yes stop_codon:yes gene_type:complete